MSLVTGDMYEMRFKLLLGKLNEYRKSKKRYNEITEKMWLLVGEMIGEIDSHNCSQTTSNKSEVPKG